MSPPLVSVVMGTYNQERYVREALDSALAQTYSPIEIIVADDASSDDTVEIVKTYGDRIRLVTRSENSGGCQATRNLAIRHARGSYIAFLDHDDAWYPAKLEKQVAFMESHPDIPLSHTYCEIMDADSKIVGIRHEGQLPATGPCFRELLRHCFITISSVMVRANIFDNVGGFNEDRTLLSEDYEFFLRVAKQFPIGLINEPLIKYRKSSAGITSKRWQYQPRVVPFHRRVLDNPAYWQGAATRAEVLDVYTEACLENCQFWRDQQHYKRAIYFATQAISKKPLEKKAWSQFLKSTIKPLIHSS